jgi:hypothetical protein
VEERGKKRKTKEIERNSDEKEKINQFLIAVHFHQIASTERGRKRNRKERDKDKKIERKKTNL